MFPASASHSSAFLRLATAARWIRSAITWFQTVQPPSSNTNRQSHHA